MSSNSPNFPVEKAAKIKLLILDVDGVLTSGQVFYGSAQEKLVGFHIHDGLGMKLLQKSGVPVAIITSRKSEAVATRMQDLGIDNEFIFQGQTKKITAFETVRDRMQITDAEIACMGDDLPDLPMLQRAGLAVTVPRAPEIIRQHADWITTVKAGKGAVRELCEKIMQAQNTFLAVTDSWLQGHR